MTKEEVLYIARGVFSQLTPLVDSLGREHGVGSRSHRIAVKLRRLAVESVEDSGTALLLADAEVPAEAEEAGRLLAKIFETSGRIAESVEW
jgi:hypothetical protein